eukprot:517277_1
MSSYRWHQTLILKNLMSLNNDTLEKIYISLVLGEILHSGLAIMDFVSDVLLLIAISDTQNSYDSYQQRIDDTIDSNQYNFEYCLPASIQSQWTTQTNSDCVCEDIGVYCDDTETIVIEQTHYGNESNDTYADYGVFSEIAISSISCKPYLWALDYEYRHSFTFSNWTCTRCECIGDLYSHSTSIALLKTDTEYAALYDDNITYCNPYKLLEDNYNDNLNTIVIVCWTFVIVGGIIQCLAVCGRALLTYIFIDGEKDHAEDVAFFHFIRFGVGFFVSLLEDVPQTIVAMYYLQFLYVDNGYFCMQSFSEYPRLKKMSIDPQESISVILLENPSIAFAVVSSIVMIAFNGIKSGFKIQSNIRKEMKDDDGNMKYQVLSVCIIGFITLLYVLSLLMPIAAVAYYDIAPHFHKTWTPAFVTFVAGCVAWGIMCCAACVGGCIVVCGNM